MKKLTRAADAASEELGRWVGRRDAFAAIAGRCSAAEVESLRHVREKRLYRNIGLTWDEFCRTRLGTSRQHIERTLRLFDEFGPQYFHVAQMTHISPEEYRAIAPHVGEEGVRVNGAVVALLPENSDAVSAAVTELLRREKPAPAAPARVPVDTVLKRAESLCNALAAMEMPEEAQQNRLAYIVTGIMNAAEAKGAPMPAW